METAKNQIIITVDPETKQASYTIIGMGHSEAQRVMFEIIRDNHEHAVGEAVGHHHHENGGGHDH